MEIGDRAQNQGMQAGRNEPCPCGSGKKYKRCCLETATPTSIRRPRPTPPFQNDQLLARALEKHQAGQIREAQSLYSEILESDPSHRDALHFAGIAAHQAGDSRLAISLMERSFKTGPGPAHQYINFGQVLEASGLLDRALACYEKAVALDSGAETGHIRLGTALLDAARPADAAMSFSKALRMQAESFEAINGLGKALQRMGRLEQAIVCFQKAISLKPESVSVLNNCGVALYDLGRVDGAVACYRQALNHNPESAEILSNLGEALRTKGDLEESTRCLKKAIEIQPDFASAYTNLATTYLDQGLLPEAVSTYRKSIEIDPQNALAHGNMANALAELDKVEEAIESYSKAIEYAPAKNEAFSALLYMHSAFQFASPQQECELARNWEKVRLRGEERAAARARASASSGAFSPEPRNGRALRVGIVSAELGRHVVAVFLQPFLDQLDHRRVHLTLFPTVLRKDPLADHFRSLAEATIPLIGVPDALAAARIREERIDVLVDTTGHTSHCHLGIFAHRAAPVQCSYIGYWSTTGLTEMDWYISDEGYSHGCETHFTEKLWKLPHHAHCYYGDESLPGSGWAPDPDGTIWLGSFNRYNKVRRETLSLWAKVLKALPHARLLLEDRVAYPAETHERIRTVLGENGVAGERVVFLPRVMNSDFATHMRLYDWVDIALDTIPANSGATAFDALWMGVPLVALEGTRVCGRMAASILKVLGRPDWVAGTQEEYVSIVGELARDVEGRAVIRTTLRCELRKSELCDGKGLARSLEDAFEAMYDRWLVSG
jgi:predicted O-linked N-acetylglucosamine transferase (SPINDLY family)